MDLSHTRRLFSTNYMPKSRGAETIFYGLDCAGRPLFYRQLQEFMQASRQPDLNQRLKDQSKMAIQ